MATHRAQGERVVYVDGDAIWSRPKAHGASTHRAGATCRSRATARIGFQVENVMAAVAAAWAVGLDWDTIRSGLASFVERRRQRARPLQRVRLPRRDRDRRLRPQPRRDARAGGGGRRDAGQAPLGGHQRRRRPPRRGHPRADRDPRRTPSTTCCCTRTQRQRGRADGEVLALLRQGLQGAARTRHVEEIRGEFVAIDTRAGAPAAGRPVPDPGRPGRRGAGAHGQAHRRGLKPPRRGSVRQKGAPAGCRGRPPRPTRFPSPGPHSGGSGAARLRAAMTQGVTMRNITAFLFRRPAGRRQPVRRVGRLRRRRPAAAPCPATA